MSELPLPPTMARHEERTPAHDAVPDADTSSRSGLSRAPG